MFLQMTLGNLPFWVIGFLGNVTDVLLKFTCAHAVPAVWLQVKLSMAAVIPHFCWPLVPQLCNNSGVLCTDAV